ncbi:MAG: DUF6046 domain-containing protein [Bacteroidales bacterium]|nr:DUF6046 domain-containing protein [Bacteroidales bacterium]
MALTKYDIGDLFQLVWNYRALPYPMLLLPDGRLLDPKKLPKYDPILIPARKETSELGVPFYSVNNVGMEIFMPVWLNGLQLENTVVSMSLKKIIVETPLTGRSGSVKEMISTADWEIDIKGIIVSNSNDYPDAEVKELKDLIDLNEALEIQNVLTAICLSEGQKVIVDEFRLLDNRGVDNAQPFEIRLTSDIPFELIIE